jgi:cytochrome c553
MKGMKYLTTFLTLVFAVGIAFAAMTVPLVIQQPGTQPQEIGNLSGPDRCDNCHGGYNTSVEPAFNWRGSMMANAGRDPIFWATMAVAEQDFDGAGDLCIRCHSTAGWLAGRSTPTDGSGLAAGDSDGVECDFCHKMTNPKNLTDDPNNFEWAGVQFGPFIANDEVTPATGYYGSGMSSMWGGSDMLGPYAVTNAKHQFLKSKFHRDREFCGTCHDVSNPAVGDLALNNGSQSTADPVTLYPLDPDVTGRAAFNNFPYMYGIVERTFSEYMSSDVPFTKVDDFSNLPADLQGGALLEMYNAATKNGTLTTANYEDGESRFYTCQTCHMRPVTGQGCNKNPEIRDDLPLHDMTGGNYWMPEAIKYLDVQGKLRLGGGLSATQIAALDAGALRAKEQLDLAATLSVQGNSVKIINHTGHKLISGYPEGRRMWLNIKWYDAVGNLLREDGEYGPLFDPNSGDPIMAPVDQPIQVKSIKDLYDPNTKIYEAHYGMTQEWAGQLMTLGYPGTLALSYDRYNPGSVFTLGELASQAPGTYHETFHFVLNNKVIKDNRIPPYGMKYDEARKRNALPVPENQYGGGPGKTYEYFDTFHLSAPQGAASAIIDLLYQPTSYEYQLFLLKANTKQNAFLALEGDYMFEAWLNIGMAAPYVMASTTWHDPTIPQCNALSPVLISAVPSSQQVDITWQPVDPPVDGYKLYYDQAGKAQLVADVGLNTAYTDTGLTNGQEYCYKVTSYYTDSITGAICESGFSSILCAIPNAGGQLNVGVDTMQTGLYVKQGKGKNAVTVFEPLTSFTAGEGVVIRAQVIDVATGIALQNATVDIAITGPELVFFTTGPSDVNGIAEVTWQTQAPNKKGVGGTTPGAYTATTTNVTATGYTWDGLATFADFDIN